MTDEIKKDTLVKVESRKSIDEFTAEKLFQDWVTNNKTIAQLAKENGCTDVMIRDIKKKYRWIERKNNILNKVRKLNDKEIVKIKNDLFLSAKKAIKILSKKMKDIQKSGQDGIIVNTKDGTPVLADPFFKNAKDFKAMVETFYLILNDGVKETAIDAKINHQISLDDNQAADILKILGNSYKNDAIPAEVIQPEEKKENE